MIGWVQISRREVARAEQALLGEGKGVRDELGLLSIHQAISDRLFPGTSVLHTRLRYALFVPWLMRRAAARPVRSHTAALRDMELRLTGQLVGAATADEAGQKGIIGGRVYQRSGAPAAQPPSFAYWTALSTWHILGAADMRRGMSRDHAMHMLHEATRDQRHLAKDELGNPIHAAPPLFAGLPDEPPGLLEQGTPMTFILTTEERAFLRNRLLSVMRPGDELPSLLALLANKRIGLEADMPWQDARVLALVDDSDRKLLRFAEGISALAGIARGVYLAMLEEACRKQGLLTTRIHRDRLEWLVSEYGKAAMRLDLDDRPEGEVGLDDVDVVALLRATQAWVLKADGITRLKPLYLRCEKNRKAERARLPETQAADVRRRDWVRYEGTGLADRLHFRWSHVKRLLNDLHLGRAR
jgi:hypothetical protein